MCVAVRAVRGAIQVEANEREEILAGTKELVTEVMNRNYLRLDEVISVLFSTTPDLDAEFPAVAARQAGFTEAPLMCCQEIPVPGALPRVVRLMMHVDTELKRPEVRHVYLRGAAALRLDIAQ
jgi:chorismate mutase